MNLRATLGKERLVSALSVRRAVMMDDETAAGKRREPVERYREVLTGHRQIRRRQQTHCLLEQFDGAPFARTAVVLGIATDPLSDERVRIIVPAEHSGAAQSRST